MDQPFKDNTVPVAASRYLPIRIEDVNSLVLCYGTDGPVFIGYMVVSIEGFDQRAIRLSSSWSHLPNDY